MAADHGKDDDLPTVWPFTLAGLLVLVGICWFCLGFALADMKKDLPGHYTVWWVCVIAAFVLCVAGGTYNMLRARRRREALGA